MTIQSQHLAVFLLALSGTIHAQPPEKPVRPTAADLSQWWADLAAAEPVASRALLKFAAAPDDAVAFFKTQLKPIKLSPEELESLLADLGSDEESTWKPAFEKLQTYDPRLAMSLVDLMKLVTDEKAQPRLVDVLSNVPPGTYEEYAPIKLERNNGPDDSYNFRGRNCSWWAEVRVARINTQPWQIPKMTWTRAVRAVVLLQQIDTPEARAIVADMTTGHPDALPTRVAKDSSFALPAMK